MAATLHPIVYWAQTEDNIYLKVDLSDTVDPDIDVTAEGLYFKAHGVGAGGLHEYQFTMDFYRTVNPDKSSYRVLDRAVEFKLTKDGPALYWPRLIRNEPKPAWLRIDFDKWKSEDDSDEEEDGEDVVKREQEHQVNQIEKELLETKDKDEEPAFADMRTAYLFIYNLLQFIGYFYVVVYIFSRYALHGKANMEEAFDRAIIPLGICQMCSFLEIVHPLVGLVKTGVTAPLMQVIGRNVLLFLVVIPNPEVHSEPMVCYLFLVWSAIEVFRYPFYMVSVIDYYSEVLTWLRYTVWIPLYPLGFLSEVIVIYLSISYFEATKTYSVSLPNEYNFSFYFPYWLYTHMAIIVISTVLYLSTPYYETTGKYSVMLPNEYNFSIYYPYVIYAYISSILILAPSLISHMWKQRQKRFGPKKPRRKFHKKLN